MVLTFDEEFERDNRIALQEMVKELPWWIRYHCLAACMIGRYCAIIWSLRNWILVAMILAFITPAIALPQPGNRTSNASEVVKTRVRREGFGPWEAQEVWDEKGKSNVDLRIIEFIDEIVNETIKIEGFLNQTIEAFRHPITKLLETKVGVAILILVSLSLVVVVGKLVGYAWPVFRFILAWFWKIISWPFSCACMLTSKLGCTMWFCAMSPCVCLRNYLIRREKRKYDNEIPLVEEEFEVPLKRIYARLNHDDFGLYVCSDDKTRIYIADQKDRIEALVTCPPNRFSGEQSRKETVLPQSIPRKVLKMPGYQGVFKIDGVVIGYFSRIKWQGRDCLLTAYHVLEYSRSGIVRLCNDKKEVYLHEVRASILACSPSEEYDYLLLQIPTVVFSKLGLKQGRFAPRISMGSPIAIFQLHQGEPVVTTAIARVHPVKPWHMTYAATTFVGTSGAPVVNLRKQIVGVHLESCIEMSCNVGVIPQLLRTKESDSNEELMAGQPELEEEDWERYERFEEPDEFYDDAYVDLDKIEKTAEEYRVLYFKDNDFDRDATPQGWAEEMNAIDAWVDLKFEDNEQYRKYLMQKAQVFATVGEHQGKHINKRVKGGKFRKESVWVCSKCGLLHLKKGYTCKNPKCGYALTKKLRDDSQSLKDADMLAETLRGVVPNNIVEGLKKEIHQETIRESNVQDLINESIKEGWEKGFAKWYDHFPNLINFPSVVNGELPNTIAITKDLKTKLNLTNPTLGNASVDVVDDKLVVKTKVKVRSFAEAEALNKPSHKVQVIEDLGVKVKTVKRKRNRNKKKETVENAQSSVAKPLNSRAPLRGGANAILGENPEKSFLDSQPSLDTANASSLKQLSEKSLVSGLRQRLQDLHAKNTVGRVEVQKPKK